MPVPSYSPSTVTISVTVAIDTTTTIGTTMSSDSVTSLASAVETSVGVSSISVFDVASAGSRRSGRGCLFDTGLTDLRNTTVVSGKMAVAVTRETSRLDIRSLLTDSRSTEGRGSILASEGTVSVIGSLGKSICASKSSISAVSVDGINTGTDCVAGAEGEGLSAEGSAVENTVATNCDGSSGSSRSNSVSLCKGGISAVSSGAGLLSTEVISTSSTESIAKCDVSTGTLWCSGGSGSWVGSSEGGVVTVSTDTVTTSTKAIEAISIKSRGRASRSNWSSGSTVRSSKGGVVAVRAGAVSLGVSSIIES